MSDDNVSRRAALELLSVGVAGALVTRATGAGAESLPTPDALPSEAEHGVKLLAPLAPGSRLGRWRVEQIHPLSDGATSVVLADAAGALFQLDVCKRDAEPGALRGPGVSERFEVFLANGGDGNTGTHEDHGLAAMALAELIRGNESTLSLDGFLTLRERIAADHVRRHVG